MTKNEKKKEMYKFFMLQMEPYEEGLEFSSIYGIYTTMIKDKDMTYSSCMLRRLLNEDTQLLVSNEDNPDKFITRYKIRPRLFNYLEEDSERGEIARNLYKESKINKKNTDRRKYSYISKDIARIDVEKDEEPIKRNKTKNIHKQTSIAYNSLRSAIYTIASKELVGAKLLALSHVKKVYDKTILPFDYYSSLDMYTKEAVDNIKKANTIAEVKGYKEMFNKEIEILNKRAKGESKC